MRTWRRTIKGSLLFVLFTERINLYQPPRCKEEEKQRKRVSSTKCPNKQGWLVGWSVGWLVGRLVGQSVLLIVWPIYIYTHTVSINIQLNYFSLS